MQSTALAKSPSGSRRSLRWILHAKILGAVKFVVVGLWNRLGWVERGELNWWNPKYLGVNLHPAYLEIAHCS